MPLPKLDDFLQSVGDGPERQLAARALDLFEAYLEGHPVSQYDPAQEAWFAIFLDGRSVSTAEKEEILRTIRSYLKFTGEPPSASPSGSGQDQKPLSKDLQNRFKPGPAMGPPPATGKKRPGANPSTRFPKARETARKVAESRGIWLAPVLILLTLLWACYLAFIDKPFADFEFDIRQRLRSNNVSMTPPFGAWVVNEGQRRGFMVIPEKSGQKIIAVNTYYLATEPMQEIELRVCLNYQTPFGFNWTRTLEIVDETYLTPGDWPPPRPIVAATPRQQAAHKATGKIPKAGYQEILSALEGARTNILKFYEENPDQTLELVGTESARIEEQMAALPEPRSDEEHFLHRDLGESLDRISRIAIALRMYQSKSLDGRQLRQEIDTLIAQSEYAQRKAESRLGE